MTSRFIIRIYMITLLAFIAFFCLTADCRAENVDNVLQAENSFFRGSHLLSRENYSEAVVELEKAVKLDPQNSKYASVLAVAYNNLGLRFNKDGNFREGLKSLEKALETAPEDKDIQNNFVQSVFHAINLPEEKLSIEEKIHFATRLLKIDQQNAAAKKHLSTLLNNFGIRKGKVGDHEGEIVQLEKALELDPANPKIKKNLSTAYFNLAVKKGKGGDYQEEINLLKAAQKMATKDSLLVEHLARALSNLAVLKGKQGDFAGQIALLKESLEVFSGDPVTKSNLAAAYNNYAVSGSELKLAERISMLEESLKLDPKNKAAATNLSNLFVKEALKEAKGGSVDKATDLLEKALKVDPNNKAAHRNLAALYHNEALKKGEEGKHEHEVKLLQKALNLDPANAEIKADLAAAYNDYAVSLGKKGDSKQEILFLTKAAKLLPDNKVIQENLTKAKQKSAATEEKKETSKKKNKES